MRPAPGTVRVTMHEGPPNSPSVSDMVSGPLTFPRVPFSGYTGQAGMFFFQPGMMHLRAAKESTVAR
ncbi:unnamed protein product [Lota lota]